MSGVCESVSLSLWRNASVFLQMQASGFLMV